MKRRETCHSNNNTQGTTLLSLAQVALPLKALLLMTSDQVLHESNSSQISSFTFQLLSLRTAHFPLYLIPLLLFSCSPLSLHKSLLAHTRPIIHSQEEKNEKDDPLLILTDPIRTKKIGRKKANTRKKVLQHDIHAGMQDPSSSLLSPFQPRRSP